MLEVTIPKKVLKFGNMWYCHECPYPCFVCVGEFVPYDDPPKCPWPEVGNKAAKREAVWTKIKADEAEDD